MNPQNISDLEEDDTVFTFSSVPRALPPDARTREDEFRLQSRGNATTPIQHSPNEIMSEIFMFWAYGGGPSRGRTARHLSTVCSRWRDIAINDPRLWTRPNLTFLGRSLTDESITVLEEILLRSRPCKLSLRIKTLDPRTPGLEHILLAVVSSMERLEGLTLELPETALQTLNQFTQESRSLPALKFFKYESNLDSPADLDVVFPVAPVLQKVRLQYRARGIVRHWTMPWHQLTTFRSHRLFSSLSEARDTLLACSSVAHCTMFYIPYPDPGEITSPIPLRTLPNLRVLYISFDHASEWDRAAQFFQPLNIPSLTKLELSVGDGSNAREIPLLCTNFFSRSGPSFSALRLDGVIFGGITEVTNMFQLLPALEHFHCDGCQILDHSFFEVLYYHGPKGPAPLVPCLKTLSVYEEPDWMEYSPRAAVRMIQSRWWSDADSANAPPNIVRWERVRLSRGGEELKMGKKLQAVIDKCRAEGLDIDL